MELDHKRMYEATCVMVRKPDGKWLFSEAGPMRIVLDTGKRVWIASSYYFDGCDPEGLRVRDPEGESVDYHGTMIHSVPADWCTFYTEEEAETIEFMMDADNKLLGYAH
jgi:hypothetical protein